ncbi:MAG TPA: hypothetical protein PLO77_08090 [Thermoclostridium caenicola]|nr:hypothetical protein [Thermoclostridium caenicola]
MDNRFSSILKRALRVTADYVTAFILFCVLSASVFGLVRTETPVFIPWISFATFLILFGLVYVDMRNIGFKENRPQYNLNPSRFKGLLYGAIGIVPVLLVQLAVLAVNVPEGFEGLKRRIFQLISGPLYWMAKILGNEAWHYSVTLVSIIVMAFLGYLAGHRKFYLTTWLKTTLGTGKDRSA